MLGMLLRAAVSTVPYLEPKPVTACVYGANNKANVDPSPL